MIKYPASYARMRGIKGKLLDKIQLESFLEAPDAKTIISALTQTAYSEQIQNSFDIFRVEHGLKQELVLYYMRILQFLSGNSANFIRNLLSKFELLNVKSIIRKIVHKIDNTSIEPFIFSLGKYHSIPIKDAIEVDSLKNLIVLMNKTPFKRPLEIGYEQYESEGTIFPIELALDLDYYNNIRNSLNSLGPIDKNGAGKLLGMQLDIVNILWILRFKEYYKLPPEKIIQYIIPYGWAKDEGVLQKIVKENDVLNAIATLGISPYDKVLSFVSPVDRNIITGTEIILTRYLYKECSHTFMDFHLQMSPILAFLIIGEMQIRDIVTILSGRNLRLSPERIRPYLITLQ